MYDGDSEVVDTKEFSSRLMPSPYEELSSKMGEMLQRFQVQEDAMKHLIRLAAPDKDISMVGNMASTHFEESACLMSDEADADREEEEEEKEPEDLLETIILPEPYRAGKVQDADASDSAKARKSQTYNARKSQTLRKSRIGARMSRIETRRTRFEGDEICDLEGEHSPQLVPRSSVASMQSQGSALDTDLRETAQMQVVLAQSRRSVRNPQERAESCDLRAWLQKFVTSPPFSVSVTCLVTLNVVLIAVEVDQSWHGEVHEAFRVLDLLFSMTFAVEVLLVMYAVGCKNFFCGPERLWHQFDLFITFMPFLELILSWALEGSQEVNNLRLLRMLRLARVLRGAKVLGFVSALRNLVEAIVSTLKSLSWGLVLLLTIFTFFGLGLTQLVVEHCRLDAISETGDSTSLPSCSEPALYMYWSSVPESILTLYMFVSGGISWREALVPLRDISWIATFLVILFVAITDLAVLNVFVGVFCNAAIEGAARSRDAVLDAFVKNKDYLLRNVEQIFKEIDQDMSGEITLDEFELGLQDARMQAFLLSLNIATDDAWRLFSLLDKDASGHLDLDEFVEGCLHLRGPATAVHFASLTRDGRKQGTRIDNLQQRMKRIEKQTRAILMKLSHRNESEESDRKTVVL